MPRFHQLFLLTRAQGHKQPDQWAQYVWQLLKSQGQQLLEESKTLKGDEENLAELNAQATTFAEKQLAILKVLQVE